MSNFTTLSSVTLTIVGAVALALGLALWAASVRVGQMRLRFVAAGFFVLAAKSVIVILLIHQAAEIHHEVVQSLDAVMDLVAVLLVATPFVLRVRE
ncbi:MAG: hypothetical protein AABX89_07585 [Candidatus Thermoplasmatota archaeon]